MSDHMGHCPACGSQRLAFYRYEEDDYPNCLYREADCLECGAHFREFYNVMYRGTEIMKDEGYPMEVAPVSYSKEEV